MSRFECPEANVERPSAECAVELQLKPQTKDLGGFQVRRALPSAQRQTVGPFIFFDQMGPSGFQYGEGIDVRPHPHIGLATITYLFEGAIMHRDSLGTELVIRPGDVNWMKAGRGIVHSERTPEELRGRTGHRLHGIQAWVALPTSQERAEPAFTHYPEADLPRFEHDGVRISLIAGQWLNRESPVLVDSPTLYAEVRSDRQTELIIPDEYAERALYIVEGEVVIADERYDAGSMVVLRPGATVSIGIQANTHFMLLGGDPVDGQREIWWNFVASKPELMDQARADWKAGRFEPVPNETEHIPLPE